MIILATWDEMLSAARGWKSSFLHSAECVKRDKSRHMFCVWYSTHPARTLHNIPPTSLQSVHGDGMGYDVCWLSRCRLHWVHGPGRSPSSAHAKHCLFLICWLIPAGVGRQSAHSSPLTLRAARGMPACLTFSVLPSLPSPPPLLPSRLLPLPEDLPVHAAGLHFRHIVSVSPPLSPPLHMNQLLGGFWFVFGCFSPLTWQGPVMANKPQHSDSMFAHACVCVGVRVW